MGSNNIAACLFVGNIWQRGFALFFKYLINFFKPLRTKFYDCKLNSMKFSIQRLEMEPRERLSKCLQVLVAIGLTAIFAFHSQTQITKYALKNTTLAMDYQKMDSLKFPVVIICVREGILRKNASLLAKEEFLKYHRKPQVNFFGLSTEENVYENVRPGTLKDDFIPTVYNGMCKRTQLLASYLDRTWMSFHLNSSFEYDVWFLNEGDVNSFVTQTFSFMPIGINIRSSVQIELEMAKFENFDPDGFKCKNYDKRDQIECLHEFSMKAVNQLNASCLSYPLEFILGHHLNSSCKDPAKAGDSFFPILSAITSAINNADKLECPQPCESIFFTSRVAPFSSNSFLDEDGMYSVFIYYPNRFIRVDSRYVLMDFVTLVSGLGGLLGLYLGFSFFTIFSNCISSVCHHSYR